MKEEEDFERMEIYMKKIFASLFGIFFALQFFGMHFAMADFSGNKNTSHKCCQELSSQKTEENILKSHSLQKDSTEKHKCCIKDQVTVSSSTSSSLEKKKIKTPNNTDFQKFLENFSEISGKTYIKKIQKKQGRESSQEFLVPNFLAQKKITVLRI